MMQDIDQKPKRAIVAAVQRPSVSDLEFEASLTELRQLAKTLGFEVVGKFTQKRAGFDSAAYFGKGKREELRLLREQYAADVVLVDHEVSPSQQFSLAKEVGCEVMDRTMVILEIFHRHASSRYARAQVEISPLDGQHSIAIQFRGEPRVLQSFRYFVGNIPAAGQFVRCAGVVE